MPRFINHMTLRRAIAPAVLLSSVLAGCSDLYFDRRETVTFAAGDALATAQAVQVVDPWPAASASRDMNTHGSKVQGAMERYRTGNIIQPRGTGTSSAGYGGTGLTPSAGVAAPQPAASSQTVK